MPGQALIEYIDRPATPDEVHFDFYLMTRAMYKLWLLEDKDERQRLIGNGSEPLADPIK